MSFPKPTPAESIATVARHLQYAIEQSTTIKEAFELLYAAADQQQKEPIRQLEQLLRSPQPDGAIGQGLRLSSYPTLAWLLHQTASPERSAAAMLREYQRHESFSATTKVVVW